MAYQSRESALVARGHITQDTACDGKRAYLTKGEARHARDRVSARIGRPMHSYTCPFCSMYHIARDVDHE